MDPKTIRPIGRPSIDAAGNCVTCDTTVQNLIFIDRGLGPIITLVLCYLIFVTKLGPMIMDKRQAFSLRAPIRIYNFINIFVNGWLSYQMILKASYGLDFFRCIALEPKYSEYARLADLIILSRVIDFLDTIFFVLRKKYTQVTGLHMFHHSVMPIVLYIISMDSMTGFSAFPILINSVVHVVMYFYYFLATYESLKPYLWWKNLITIMQILQFIAIILYCTLGRVIFSKLCNRYAPIMPVVVILTVAFIFLVQFSLFYMVTYKKKPKAE